MPVQTMRARFNGAGLLLMAGLLLAPFPARAQEAAGPSFSDLVLIGCVPAIVTGGSIADYARLAGLRKDPRMTARLQQQLPQAIAFLAPRTKAAILQSPGMGCMVRMHAPLSPAMIGQITSMLAGEGAPFKPLPPVSSRTPGGAVATAQTFTATIRGRRYVAQIAFETGPPGKGNAIFLIAARP